MSEKDFECFASTGVNAPGNAASERGMPKAGCWASKVQENQGGLKYTINLLGKWDNQRANERNAVHFCSAECQNKYVWKSYGDHTWTM